MSFKQHFSRFLQAAPGRLHFAAHSHHLWPDVTLDAQERAWQDAAELVDLKWETRIFREVIPEAQRRLAGLLRLSDPRTIAFAPNTHEFLNRILSCFEAPCVRVLATNSEFHSFERQSSRLEEAGLLQITRIETEPFESFADRFLQAASDQHHDLVYVSHVFYDSGFVFERIEELAEILQDEDTFLVIDAYHGFLALPTDLSSIEKRAFYLAGGYKYAMSGEGACFLHCPPGFGPRPLNTGWFAGFADLEQGLRGGVSYAPDGSRFQGSTIDPTPIYRLNAVLRLLEELDLSVARIHDHVRALQERFLDQLDAQDGTNLHSGMLIPGRAFEERGHFLTFRTAAAGDVSDHLRQRDVITDYRRDRLRIGFGIYHDPGDVDALVAVLREIPR